MKRQRNTQLVKEQDQCPPNQTKETIAKINKAKSLFFEKINKIDKPLARLIKKKNRGEKNQINRVRNENGEITTDHKRLLSATI